MLYGMCSHVLREPFIVYTCIVVVWHLCLCVLCLWILDSQLTNVHFIFQAYKCWMSANVKFEQQKWQESLQEFGQCQYVPNHSITTIFLCLLV